MFSEIIHLIKIILIASATYTILKNISISILKRVKTTFFTMTDSRLDHLLLVLVYIDELDEINIKIMKNLIKAKDFRIATFGFYQF